MPFWISVILDVNTVQLGTGDLVQYFADIPGIRVEIQGLNRK
jgi:hypothetical protein